MEINHLRYEALAEYSTVFGYKMEDAMFIEMLSKIGCEKAIAILSRFASLHNAVCSQIQDAVYLDWILRTIHSGHIRNKGGNWQQYNQFRALMCPQSVFILEKMALVYCPIEKTLGPIQSADLMLIMDALLVVNDMLPKDVDGHETEYLYLSLYHNTHKLIKDQIARSFYVFSVLAKRDPETTDILTRYEQIRGFSVEDWLATLFNSLAFAIPYFTVEDMFTKGLCVDAENFDAKGLAPVYNKIINCVRSNYESLKDDANKSLNQVWNFEPFYRSPFVKIGDAQLAFSPTTIVYQMWDGFYWNVRYAFQANSKDGIAFMRGFGKPFEHYIQEITSASVSMSASDVLFCNEFLYEYKGNSKASTDCYCRIGNTLIAIESKAKSPHSITLTGVNRKAIDSEVDELMVSPVIQAADRLREIYSENNDIEDDKMNFFKGVEQTIILSVTMEKVQPIGELLFDFDTKVTEHLTGLNIIAYHNVNIEDFEAICNLIEKYPDEVPEILRLWFIDQRKDVRSAVVLQNFLSDIGKQYTCPEYVSNLFSNCLRTISLKTFREDLTSRATPKQMAKE